MRLSSLHVRPVRVWDAHGALAHDCRAPAGHFHRLGRSALLVRAGKVVGSEREREASAYLRWWDGWWDGWRGPSDEVALKKIIFGMISALCSHCPVANKPLRYDMSNVLSTNATLW